MPTMTPDTQVALFTDFMEKYNDWFFAAQNVNDFTVFCEVIPSSTLIENINFLETVPQYREWIDERALQAIGASYQYSVTNKHWEVSIQIDRDTVFDNRLQLERQKIAHLGLEAGRAPWQIFINALTANGVGYDSVAQFATTHTQGASGTQSNLISGTGITLSEVMTDIGTVIAAARNFLDGQGRPMNLGQKGRHILAPPAMEQTFMQIANNDFIVEPTVGYTVSNYLKGAFELTIDPYLTDTNNWYLFLTAEPGMPMIYVNRQAPEFVAQDSPESPDNFSRRMLNYGADWRSQAGYGPWYLAIEVNN